MGFDVEVSLRRSTTLEKYGRQKVSPKHSEHRKCSTEHHIRAASTLGKEPRLLSEEEAEWDICHFGDRPQSSTSYPTQRTD
jgi:hypothetical protein